MKKRAFLIILLCILGLPPIQAELQPADFPLVRLLNQLDFDTEFTFSFLLNYTAAELKVLLNACFARHGRPFQSRRMRDVFQNTSWYTVDPYYTDSELTTDDISNIKKLRSMLILSEKKQAYLYQLKRVQTFQYTAAGQSQFSITPSREQDGFLLKGSFPDPQNIWAAQQALPEDNKVLIDTLIPFTEYGPDSWFLYNDKFYFFISEDIEADIFVSYKVRRYFVCSLDLTKRQLLAPQLLAAITEEF